jgi:hypothetical protein
VTNCDDHLLALPAPDDGCNCNLLIICSKFWANPKFLLPFRGRIGHDVGQLRYKFSNQLQLKNEMKSAEQIQGQNCCIQVAAPWLLPL